MEIPFTGERFVPGCAGEIAYEHWHRYAFARAFAGGRRVLDAACGEGYGAALLGAVAGEVVGIDIDADTVAHANASHASQGRVRFIEGSCTALPFADASFDVVVSFETIEHVDAGDQVRMLAEFARVLGRDGVLVISSPNKALYSDARGYANEFHRHELYRDGLRDLLTPGFPVQRWYHQRVSPWSAIWAEEPGASAEAWLGDVAGIAPYTSPEGMYFVVVAARTAAALPRLVAYGSLFTDAEQSEQKRNQANEREALRLDALLGERDAALDQQTGHIRHLETLVAERERIVEDMGRRMTELNAAREESDRKLAQAAANISGLEAKIAEVRAALAAEQQRLEAAVNARERVIAYRQSFRWWLRLPWLRVKLWLGGSR